MIEEGGVGGDPACFAHLLDADGTPVQDDSTFVLRPRPPFRLDLTVAVAQRHRSNVVDRWDDASGAYRRALSTPVGSLLVEVVQRGGADDPELHVRVDGVPDRPFATRAEVASRLTTMLGLDLDLRDFHRLAAQDPLLAPIAERFRGVHPTRFPDWTEALTAAVSCQQLRVAAGIGLLNRLATRYGARGPDGGYGFPDAPTLASAGPAALRELGYSTRRAETVCTLARAVADGSLDPRTWADDPDEVVAALLCKLPGVGPWTATYVMLRGMGRLHLLPANDSGALGTARTLWPDENLDEASWRERARSWAPYAGLVYFHLLLAASR